MGGFSQGCGMSLHCLYEMPETIYGAIGIAGYLFPISKFDSKLANPIKIILG